MSADLLDDLRARVELDTSPAALTAASTDRSGLIPDGLPLAVVRARSVEDVSTALRLATTHGTPVVTRGAGTGLAGGAAAGRGSIVLDVSGLSRIVAIDVAEQRAVVEPGVLTGALDAAAREVGLFYAPDPASAAISTIGGNIATNAGGFRCVKYGVTRDAVLALTVVLPDGRVVRTGAGLVKDVTGYDLTSLFVGSEGTLGVVVQATVRLTPVPVGQATVSALLPDVAAGVAAVDALTRSGVRPSVVELLDGPTLGAIDVLRGTDVSASAGAFLLVQADGPTAAADAATIETVVRGHAVEVRTATDPAEADELFAMRRDALPALERLGRVLIEDISVPRGRIAEAVASIATISERHAVPIFVFAHAGDGNLHPIVLTDAAPGEPIGAAAVAAADDVFALAISLGGSISGEHGIGVLKRDWARRQLGEDVTDLHRQIRRVFDPAGILNPGKAV